MNRIERAAACIGMCTALLTGSVAATAAESVDRSNETQANHAYVPYEWCSRFTDEATISQRLDVLEEQGITYLLCDIGCYRMTSATALSNTIRYDALGAWIKLGHERGMTVLACINYAMNEHITAKTESGQTYDDWIREDVRRLSELFTKTGLDYEGQLYTADGIHMDAEPFRRPFQASFLRLMQTVRDTIGENKQLSLFCPAANGVWSDGYATQIIELMDMMCPGVYDSNGPADWGGVSDGVTQTREEYLTLVENTCRWYARLIQNSQNPDCLLSVTAPVYEDKGYAEAGGGYPVPGSGMVYYHLNYNRETGETLETLENCLTGIRKAMADGVKVDGAGIFYWPAFIGSSTAYQPSKNEHYDHEADRQVWKDVWLRMGDSDTVAATTEASSALTGTTGAPTAVHSAESNSSAWKTVGLVGAALVVAAGGVALLWRSRRRRQAKDRAQ